MIPLYPGAKTLDELLNGFAPGPAFGYEFSEQKSRMQINARRAGRPGDKRRAWPVGYPSGIEALLEAASGISPSTQALAAIALEFQTLAEATVLEPEDLRHSLPAIGDVVRIESELSAPEASYMSALVFRRHLAVDVSQEVERLLLPIRVTEAISDEPLAVLGRFNPAEMELAIECEIAALATGLTMSDWAARNAAKSAL